MKKSKVKAAVKRKGKKHDDEPEDRALFKKMLAKHEKDEGEHEDVGMSKMKSKPRLDKRARGGGVKGKKPATQVNIAVVSPGGKSNGATPTVGGPPSAPGGPPPGGLPPGGPPPMGGLPPGLGPKPGMPPGMPPPGGPPGMPPGGRPPFKKGGRVIKKAWGGPTGGPGAGAAQAPQMPAAAPAMPPQAGGMPPGLGGQAPPGWANAPWGANGGLPPGLAAHQPAPAAAAPAAALAAAAPAPVPAAAAAPADGGGVPPLLGTAPFRRGGAVKKMTAGAESGEGRLQKARMAKRK